MRKPGVLTLVTLLAFSCAGCQQDSPDRPSPKGPEVARLRSVMETIRPLYQPMGPVMFGDWLSFYPEKGQTFSQYLASNTNVPDRRRRILYVRPLGELTPAQLQIVELTAEYLERFYGLPARIAPPLAIVRVPASSHRSNKVTGTQQIQTGYLLGLLKDYLPEDAFAEIGLIATDLYPNEKMNFVFGQATLRDRVGVWSLHWLGEPDKSKAEFQECLVRTLKIASHETGHMLSIPHCTSYQCVMNGSNSMYEVDRHPLDTCPECMAKICWATRSDPRKRFEQLAAFFSRQGLIAAQLSFERPLAALNSPSSPPVSLTRTAAPTTDPPAPPAKQGRSRRSG